MQTLHAYHYEFRIFFKFGPCLLQQFGRTATGEQHSVEHLQHFLSLWQQTQLVIDRFLMQSALPMLTMSIVTASLSPSVDLLRLEVASEIRSTICEIAMQKRERFPARGTFFLVQLRQRHVN